MLLKCLLCCTRFIQSLIHSGYFYSTSSSPLLLIGAADTARILCRNFTPKSHRQLWVKDLPKVPTWRLERESNPWFFRTKASTLPNRHHVLKLTISSGELQNVLVFMTTVLQKESQQLNMFHCFPHLRHGLYSIGLGYLFLLNDVISLLYSLPC